MFKAAHLRAFASYLESQGSDTFFTCVWPSAGQGWRTFVVQEAEQACSVAD